jgi:hypothetical protein
VAAKEKKAKSAGDEKAKKKGKSSAPDTDEGSPGLSIAGHPRAVRHVAQAKAWGGLVGFLLGGYLSLPTHTLADAGLRALMAGAVCYVFAWGASLFLWRALMVAELRHAEHQLLAAELARLAPPDPQGPPAMAGGRTRSQP